MSNVWALLQDEADLLEAGTRVSRSGTTTHDWSSPTTVGTYPVAVQGLTTTEELGERDGSRARFRVYMQPGVNIDHQSRLSWNGKTLEVVGTPRTVYKLLTAEAHHIELDAKEVLG